MKTKTRWLSLAAGGALLYVAAASAWILCSDLLVGFFFKSQSTILTASLFKGFGFVAVTGLLLYLVLRRLLRTAFEAQAQAEETAHQLAEVKSVAEHSGDLYRAIFEAASDAILLIEDQRFVDCNRRALELFGASREELIGLCPGDVSPERQPDGERSLDKQLRVNRLAAAGEPQCFRWQHLRRDDTPFTAEVSMRSFKYGGKTLLLALVRDITEHTKAEEAVRASEEKLRAIYTTMMEGLALHEVVFDPAGKPVDYRILDVNPAFETVTGLRRDRMVGKLASAAYGTGTAPYLETFAAVASTGEPTSFETYFEPTNKHFAISVSSPRKGQFATVFADISKRKEAEVQICLLNRVYALVSNINEAIVRISDRDMLFREACQVAVEHAQFRMAWIGVLAGTNHSIRPVAWAGHEAGYLDAIQAAAADGTEPASQAVREGRVVICPDLAKDRAATAWSEAALARGYRSMLALPLKTGGQVVGAFCVCSAEPNFFSAIVAESLIEVAADLSFALDLFEHNRQRELEQQRLRLQHSALEAAANAIVITQQDGSVEWVNDAFSRLTGYQRDEVVGKNLRLLKSGAHNEQFYQRLWQAVLAGAVWRGTLTNKRKDGTLYDEEMTITPVRSESGAITHFVAIKQDITEQKHLEQQFLRAQRMESIGLLAGGVAHDLNNVLAPVLMALPLLRGSMRPEDRDPILDTLEQTVQRGANVVQQVLTFARGVEVQRVSVQLRHLIREVTKIAEETFPRDIRIRSGVPADLWPFEGDPTQIHQVLLNLAVNARDAMPQGGVLSFTARNVDLHERLEFLDFEIPPGRYISVSVADSGTGIPPEIVERIFEPFFTTKPTGKGTGLGLSTVLGIVKSHGGLVEVHSKPDAGSTFTVYLPAAPPDSVTEDASQRTAWPRGHGETILVVDDEPGILQVSQSVLEANGYQVITAEEGRQGISRFAERSDVIKVVITDLMMPVMDGLALTRAMRQCAPTLPIIVATGLLNAPGEGDRTAELREQGVQHILRKPFTAEELLITVNAALTGKAPAG